MRTFNEVLLAWLQGNGYPEASQIVQVEGEGNDWQGSTEGGFYHVFECSITYRDDRDQKGYVTVQGEEMQSLWQAVIGAFPAEPVSEPEVRRRHTWSEMSLGPRHCTSCGKRASDLIAQPYCTGSEG